MPFQTAPGTEIIAGYRLVQRLGIGGFGEVWKTTAPGGLTKALKIVFGHLDESRATQELKALDRRVSRFSDQYSLAVVYQEMMTGLRPFPGTTTLQLALQHSSSEPLLHPLPVMDRPAIARALSKVPEQRFATCREMVASLLAASPAKASEEPTGSADSGAKRKTAPSVIQRRVSKRPESPDQALKAPTIVAD